MDAGRPVSYMLTDGMYVCVCSTATCDHMIYTGGKNIWEEGDDSEDNIQYDRRKNPQQVRMFTSCQ